MGQQQKTVAVDDLAEQIEAKRGNVTAVAHHFRVSRPTVYRHIKGNPQLAEILHDARESLVDMAEDWLFKRIEEGDTTAIIFFLKTQGRERGYCERRSATGTNQEWVKALKDSANR